MWQPNWLEKKYNNWGKNTHNKFDKILDDLRMNLLHALLTISRESPEGVFDLGIIVAMDPNPGDQILRTMSLGFHVVLYDVRFDALLSCASVTLPFWTISEVKSTSKFLQTYHSFLFTRGIYMHQIKDFLFNNLQWNQIQKAIKITSRDLWI